jgi:hypothetical protein
LACTPYSLILSTLLVTSRPSALLSSPMTVQREGGRTQ